MNNKWIAITACGLLPILSGCSGAQGQSQTTPGIDPLPCALHDITGKLAGEYTASGHLHSSYSLTNTSQQSCLIEKPVAFRSVGENDDQSPETVISSSNQRPDNQGKPGLAYPVTLAPGASVYFEVYRASAINSNTLGLDCHVEKLTGLNVYINHSQVPVFVKNTHGNACLDSTHDIFSTSVLSHGDPLEHRTP